MESYENCMREAEQCLAIAQDETRTAEERFGATLGEIDWRSAALDYKPILKAPFPWLMVR